MVAEPPHTAPGSSRPGYASTCPQAHPATPSPDDDVCHQNQLRPSPKERVMAPHRGHQTGASSLTSRAQQVSSRHPPADVSLPTVISPALNEPVLSASPPRAREVPHLHMHRHSFCSHRRACAMNRSAWVRACGNKNRACTLNRITYMRACAMNRSAWVRACGNKNRAYTLNRSASVRTCSLHRRALTCACSFYRRTSVHSCQTYRRALMHACSTHRHALNSSYRAPMRI
jgi:hypothetical protein